VGGLNPHGGRMQKEWEILCDYEENRLAMSYSVDTYESLVPRKKYKINPNQKIRENDDIEIKIKQIQGVSK
jgi:ribosomal protein S3AE